MKSNEEIKDYACQKHGYENFESFDDKLTFGQEKEVFAVTQIIDICMNEAVRQAVQHTFKRLSELTSEDREDKAAILSLEGEILSDLGITPE